MLSCGVFCLTRVEGQLHCMMMMMVVMMIYYGSWQVDQLFPGGSGHEGRTRVVVYGVRDATS